MYASEDLHGIVTLPDAYMLSYGCYLCQELGAFLQPQFMGQKDWEHIKLSCGTSLDHGVKPACLKQLQHQV